MPFDASMFSKDKAFAWAKLNLGKPYSDWLRDITERVEEEVEDSDLYQTTTVFIEESNGVKPCHFNISLSAFFDGKGIMALKETYPFVHYNGVGGCYLYQAAFVDVNKVLPDAPELKTTPDGKYIEGLVEAQQRIEEQLAETGDQDLKVIPCPIVILETRVGEIYGTLMPEEIDEFEVPPWMKEHVGKVRFTHKPLRATQVERDGKLIAKYDSFDLIPNAWK